MSKTEWSDEIWIDVPRKFHIKVVAEEREKGTYYSIEGGGFSSSGFYEDFEAALEHFRYFVEQKLVEANE